MRGPPDKSRVYQLQPARPANGYTPSPQALTVVSRRIDFDKVAHATLANSETIIRNLLPDGVRSGAEWCARNPTRADKSLGSFKVNIRTGKWMDGATGDRGGDLVSLAAFVTGSDQRTAALRLADALGVDPFQ